jgi:hypothetical protein
MYATTAQVALFMHGDADHEMPDDTPALIRVASDLVDGATTGAVYATDADELPTEPRVASAMRKAVARQVEAWLEAGVDPRKGVAQLPRQVSAKSANGVSVTYDDGAARAALESLASGRSLHPDAWGYLNRAGLTSSIVAPTRGSGASVILDAREYDPITGAFL